MSWTICLSRSDHEYTSVISGSMSVALAASNHTASCFWPVCSCPPCKRVALMVTHGVPASAEGIHSRAGAVAVDSARKHTARTGAGRLSSWIPSWCRSSCSHCSATVLDEIGSSLSESMRTPGSSSFSVIMAGAGDRPTLA
ncbi:hypothetical protein D1872_284080 [compost metagenome]